VIRRSALTLLVAALGSACSDPGDPPPVRAGSGLRFRDATTSSGLGAFLQTNGSPEKELITGSFGAGVALFDPDGDGDLDAYLSNGGRNGDDGGPPPRDALFANDGRGSFTDVSREAGIADERWTAGVRTVDLDGDGWTDVYLTNLEENRLYRNAGDGTFVDGTEAAGLGDPRWSTGAAFFDPDRDGDLDLYLVNYVVFDREWILANHPRQEYRGERVFYGPRGLTPESDAFLENQGGGVFRDRTAERGLEAARAFGFQAVAFDYDDDGWVDVYVANDSMPNFLWRNEAGARFTDRALRAGLAVSVEGVEQAGMGVAVADFDGDQLVDVYVTNFAEDYHTLYQGRGGGLFDDVTQRRKLRSPTLDKLGWGCGFHDFDDDGDLDLYAANGHVYPQVDAFDLNTEYRQQNQLFANDGGRLEVLVDAGGGFELRRASRGSAVGDVDGDGDLDVLFGNLDSVPTLLVNEGASGGSLAVVLVQEGENRDALGARVTARWRGPDGPTRALRLVGAAQGFLSSDGPALHFGLGEAAGVEELVVRWPDGTTETWRDLPSGHVATLTRGVPEPRLRPYPAPAVR